MRVVYFRGNIDPCPEKSFVLLFTNFPHPQPGALIDLYGYVLMAYLAKLIQNQLRYRNKHNYDLIRHKHIGGN